jgi:hypothetical protein
MEEEAEYSFKIDSWARQEIREIRERLDSIPPPLEDAPFESPKNSTRANNSPSARANNHENHAHQISKISGKNQVRNKW